MSRDRVEELKKEMAQLKSRWPAHSVPPALMQQLDELEDELKKELKMTSELDKNAEIRSQVFLFRAIGYVENEIDEPVTQEQYRSAEARIVLAPALVEGLEGYEPGQQIMVIFFFHHSECYDLLQHPRGDKSRPKRGVFALRSPRRPNPIGVTIVELVFIEGNTLTVRGLDAIHGTPVLDLKPA